MRVLLRVLLILLGGIGGGAFGWAAGITLDRYTYRHLPRGPADLIPPGWIWILFASLLLTVGGAVGGGLLAARLSRRMVRPDDV